VAFSNGFPGNPGGNDDAVAGNNFSEVFSSQYLTRLNV
jgi:hypothetical protein